MQREVAQSKVRPFGWTDLSLLLVAIIWAINYSVVKYAALIMGPLAFTGLRVCLAAIILVALTWMFSEPLPSRKDLMKLLVLGMIGNGIYQLLFVSGVAQIRIATAVLIVASAPACIAIISRLRGSERLGSRAIAGILLSIAGVGMVILDNHAAAGGRTTTFGVLFMIAAVLCWSIFTVGLHPITHRVHPWHISTVTMVGGAIPCLLFTPLAVAHIQWSEMPMKLWMGLFYSILVSVVVAYYFWFRGIRVIGATRTSVYANLQPVVAIVVAWFMLHEMPTMWQGIGAGTIMSGVLLARS
jgi:drug/metabolite transporter (DMT)-like permease